MDDEEEELMGANQIIDGDNKETSDLYMSDQEEELIIFDRWYMSMLSTFDTFDKKIYINYYYHSSKLSYHINEQYDIIIL